MAWCNVIAFSKDRAFQLRELLRTWRTFTADTSLLVRFTVIYAASPSHEKSYIHLSKQYPHVVFAAESEIEESSFACLLDRALHPPDEAKAHSAATDVVLFLVDDMIAYAPVPLDALAASLTTPPACLGAYCALHPGVTYCHPADSDASVPPILPADQHVCKFLRCLGSHDWSYPWSLAGGMYLLRDAQRLFLAAAATGHLAVSHPNRLEVAGNQALQTHPLAAQKQFGACPRAECMAVVTVNRVQEVYRNRVYEVSADDAKHDGVADTGVDALEALYWSTCQLDEAAIAAKPHNSVHIGDFSISHKQCADSARCLKRQQPRANKSLKSV